LLIKIIDVIIATIIIIILICLENLSVLIVKGDFYCRGNKLTTLEGKPEKINGSFVYDKKYLQDK